MAIHFILSENEEMSISSILHYEYICGNGISMDHFFTMIMIYYYQCNFFSELGTFFLPYSLFPSILALYFFSSRMTNRSLRCHASVEPFTPPATILGTCSCGTFTLLGQHEMPR